jgi:hypothetical protein
VGAADVDPVAVVLAVTDVLDRLGVRYFLGGSLAGAVHGVVRATADADLVADLEPRAVAPLVAALAAEFHVDNEAVEHAVRERRSFNILHRESMFKVDVFLTRGTPFEASQMGRRHRETVSADSGASLYVATAEDTVLAKLVWFRSGGEVSERQWRDVVELIRAGGPALDRDYIARWAPRLDVADLWSEAIAAAEA